MPGRRIFNTFFTNTDFAEAVSNNAELLTDWDGLTNARPIPIKYLGNSWFQGSYDSATWSNSIEDDHNYIRVTTDGGTTWRVIDLTITGDSYPPVTIGSPDGGLSISGDDTQILTLSAATSTSAGSMSASHFTKLSNLRYDFLDNLGTGAEVFKDYTTLGDTRTHNLRSLTSTDGSVSFTVGTNTIDLSATGAGGGETNIAANIGTDGVGVFDNKNGVQLEFRNIASVHSGLTSTLNGVSNTIDLNLVESGIDHDLLQNFVANEHIDHSSISILTQEGITGGGTIAANRTLTLSFDTLTSKITLEDSDVFAFYRNASAEDEHYSISYSNLQSDLESYYDTIYVPLTTEISTLTGLTGGGTLDADRDIGLAFNDLPTVAYDSADYVAIYDSSNTNHAKVALSDLIGELAVSITAGNGMDFTTITSTGPITLGIPTTLTESTTNAVTSTSHSHQIDMSTFELDDIGDVPAPTANYYLRRNAGDTAYEWADPTIGASSPGNPDTSIQFNNSGAFEGSSGLLYTQAEDRIYLSAATASDSGIIFGTLSSDPEISSNNSDTIQINSDKLMLGDPTSVADRYLQIKDPNSPSQLGSTIVVTDFSDVVTFELDRSGQLSLPLMTSAVEDNVVYYDTATGLLTYGAAPVGSGGIATINTDTLSGLMVNGGNTSSASTIELDQNDNKLTTATAIKTDYIGFWDVSTGLQSKTAIADLPGWDLKVNGVEVDEVNPAIALNFQSGTGVTVAYNDTTNTMTFSSGSSVLEDIAFEFADLTGDAQQYTLDLKASFGYTILNTILEADAAVSGTVTGGSATITFTNVSTLEEIATPSVVTTGDRIYLNITTGHSAEVIRGKLVIQRT